MIIEIIENGGIYCYQESEKILYIGKTKQSFSKRDADHRYSDTPTNFEKILSSNDNIKMNILYDCQLCPITAEQLDYLETCFINAIKPKYNIQKISQPVVKNNIQQCIPKTKYSLTKTSAIFLNTIQSNFSLDDHFTKRDILERTEVNISKSSLERAINDLLCLNIIQLLFTNNKGENIYKRLI